MCTLLWSYLACGKERIIIYTTNQWDRSHYPGGKSLSSGYFPTTLNLLLSYSEGSNATGPRDFVLCVKDILDTHSFEVHAIKTNPGLISSFIPTGFCIPVLTSLFL